MTIFDRLFKKKPKKAMESEQLLSQIDKETFIEERDPSVIFKIHQPVESEQEACFLESVLSKDYYSMGKRDGYEDHDLSYMEDYLDIVAADFRTSLHKAMDEVSERLDKMGLHLTPKAQEIMPEQYAKIKAMHDQLERQVKELTRQMDLAAMGEGYIEKSVRLYRAGFKKGYNLWLEECLLFKKSKTL